LKLLISILKKQTRARDAGMCKRFITTDFCTEGKGFQNNFSLPLSGYFQLLAGSYAKARPTERPRVCASHKPYETVFYIYRILRFLTKNREIEGPHKPTYQASTSLCNKPFDAFGMLEFQEIET